MFFSEVHKQSLGQWSPNGKYLAAAAQNRILIRNAESLKLVQVYVCLDKVERVEWSPDSEFLLTELGRQGIVQVWSLKESEWTCRIDEGLGGVAHARWGLTSKHVLISSDFQLYLSVWALEDQSIAVQIRHPKFANSGLAFSHNGRWLAMLRRCDCQDRLSLYSCEENFARLADVPLAGVLPPGYRAFRVRAVSHARYASSRMGDAPTCCYCYLLTSLQHGSLTSHMPQRGALSPGLCRPGLGSGRRRHHDLGTAWPHIALRLVLSFRRPAG
ncbi:unnamed protein product [Polarella glacialis]|uniref:WD repeat-containing protein WRAP73 n=1 Tax=Polarella glacialis TaxID=89957 RepID=A0A813DAJ0_POLGL|nr:unnamed protein product [Polarella glacialis]